MSTLSTLPTSGKRWFTHYSLQGRRTFRLYDIKVGDNGELVAIMPVSDLMDCDVLANGFDFRYYPTADSRGKFLAWSDQTPKSEINVLSTVPVGYTDFMATNRAQLYLSGKATTKTRIRVTEREGKYYINPIDLEVFWGDDWFGSTEHPIKKGVEHER